MSWQLLRCALVLAAFLYHVSSKGPNIVFEDSDLSTIATNERGEFLLEAYSAAGNDRILQSEGIKQHAQLRWFSLGEPQLVRIPDLNDPSKKPVIELTSDRMRLIISTLRASHQSQLAVTAHDKYGTSIGGDQILPLPLSNVDCSITMTDDDGQQLLLTGNTSNVRTTPIRVDFMAPHGNPARQMLERQMDNNIDALVVECTFESTGSRDEDSRSSALELTYEQIEQLGIIRKLFGGRDEVYVTRGQLMRLSSDIYSALSIQKEHNVTEDTFSEEFISGLLQQAMNSSFKDVDVDEVLSMLSTYDPDTTERRSPERIKNVLSSLFTTKIIKKQKRIAMNQSILASVTRHERTPRPTPAVTSIFGITIGPSNKIFSWNLATGWKLLAQQLSELNSFAESDVTWEVERDRVLPKTIRVVKLWRDALKHTIHFNQVSHDVEAADAPFSRMFAMEVGNAVELPTAIDVTNPVPSSRIESPSDPESPTEQQHQTLSELESTIQSLTKQLHDQEENQLQKVVDLKSDVDQLAEQLKQRLNEDDEAELVALIANVTSQQQQLRDQLQDLADQQKQGEEQQEQQQKEIRRLEARFENLTARVEQQVQQTAQLQIDINTALSIIEKLTVPPLPQPHRQTAPDRLDQSDVLSRQLVGFNASSYDGSPLHWASETGKVEAVMLLLKDGASVEAKNSKGETPLHLASMNGHNVVVTLLVHHGADIDQKNNNEWTPLHWASERGHPDTAEALIKEGARVDERRDDGWTPLHMASYWGNVETIGILVKAGANIEAKSGRDAGAFSAGSTPLHIAIVSGGAGTSAAAKYLLEHKADANVENNKGQTALHVASMHGRADIVSMLLDHAANIEAEDKSNENFTPLLWASANGHLAVVTTLLDRGAQIEAKSSFTHRNSLHLASLEGYVDIVNVLLDRGADIEAKTGWGETPLHIASFKDRLEVVKILLERGADIHATDRSGQIPLNKANEKGPVATLLRDFMKSY